MLKSGFYNLMGAIVRLVLGVVTIPLMIRALGVEGYGLWTLASAVIGMISLAEGGLSISTTFFVSRSLAIPDPNSRTLEISRILTVTITGMLLLASLGAFGLFLVAPIVPNYITTLGTTQQSELIQALRWGALLVWARLIQQVFIGIQQAYKHYGTLNLIATIQQILLTVGGVVIAFSEGKSNAIMRWYAIISLCALGLNIVFTSTLLRGINLHVSWEPACVREVARYSSMTWAGTLGGVLFTQGDRLIIGSILDLTSLGIYSAITTVAAQINNLSAVPIQPLLPHLSQLIEKGKDAVSYQEVERLVRRAFDINAFVALGCGTSLFILALPVLSLLLHQVPAPENIWAFRLGIIIYSIYSLNAVGSYVLFSMSAVKMFMVVQLSSGVIALTLIFLGANKFGLLGAVAGNLGYWGVWLFTIAGMKRLSISNLNWLSWLYIPFALSTFASLIATIFVSSIEFNILLTSIFFTLLIGWFSHTQNLISYHSLRQLIRL